MTVNSIWHTLTACKLKGNTGSEAWYHLSTAVWPRHAVSMKTHTHTHTHTETKAWINTAAFGPRSDWSWFPLFTCDKMSVLFVSCYRSEQKCYRMAQGCLRCLKLTMCAANFLCFVRMFLSSSITLRGHYGITCSFYQPGGPSTVVRGC